MNKTRKYLSAGTPATCHGHGGACYYSLINALSSKHHTLNRLYKISM